MHVDRFVVKDTMAWSRCKMQDPIAWSVVKDVMYIHGAVTSDSV